METQRGRYNWQDKLDSGEYLYKWRGFKPFWAGCFYGDSKCLGGEEKYRHCYGFFSGIGDVEYWIKDELDKLSDVEQDELVAIMTRNKQIDALITRDKVNEVANILGKQYFEIYRLGNKNIFRLLNCDDVKLEYDAICKEGVK